MNNRRQFIKKSFILGILGLFAPKLLVKDKWEDCPLGKIYYPDSRLKQTYFVKGKILDAPTDLCLTP